MNNLKVNLTVLFVFITCHLYFISPVFSQETVGQVFEKALYEEEANGDLEKAIDLYEKILKQFPQNREVAAKAQLHIGLCYEKLGLKEAENSYKKVIENYPDQTKEVERAKEKLSFLLKTKAAIQTGETQYKLSKIYSGRSYPVSVSPDGKQLALLKSEDWDIYLMDIMSKEEVRLTDESNSIEYMVWSPDSKTIVFRDMLGNLYVVSTKGGSSKMIIKADPKDVENKDKIEISGWTYNSKKIIFQIPSKGLFAILSSGGEWDEIMTFDDVKKARKYGSLRLSPNGKFIAFDRTQNGNKDIYISRIDSGDSIRITKSPSDDSSPQWSFDGQWLGFYSNRTNKPEAWVIKITPDGKPDGIPFQVSRGGVLNANWVKNKRAGYCIAVRSEHVYIADPDGSDEFQLTKFPAFNKDPRWSPDGKTIVYGSDYDQSLNTFKLWSVPSVGGQEKNITDVGWDLIWSPEGEMMIYKILKNNTIIFKRPGNEEPLKELMVAVNGEIGSLDWSPNGNNIVFIFGIKPKKYSNVNEYLRNISSGIGVIPITGGNPTILIPPVKKGLGYGSARWSSDGKKIAFGTYNQNAFEKGGEKEIPYGIWTIDSKGGEPKLIAKPERDGYKLCWTMDSNYIIFEQRIKGMEFELYKVSADGGTPEKMNILGRSVAFSPDGKKIAFSRRLEGFYEYCLVENFFPNENIWIICF